jgi:hypothetical protein
MDPFLEKPDLWPRFQRQLIAALYQAILPGLADRYRARVASRSYQATITLFTSVHQEDHCEEYLELRGRNDGKLITVIEAVSLGNRQTAEGRSAYRAARSAALQQRATVVEVDLLTAGKPATDLSREHLPEHDYLVTVTRGHAPDRHEFYPTPLPNRLPKIKLPLAPDDRDTVLDLQLAVWRALDGSVALSQLPYDAGLPADSGLSPARRDWVRDWLASGGKPS